MIESSIPPINVLVEGVTDEIVARRILKYVGLPCGPVYGKSGKNFLLKRLPNYNQAARFAPWLVLVDLDQDYDCAPDFVHAVLPHPARGTPFGQAHGMQLRVAVRAIEAWLLADAEHLAAFLKAPRARIPPDPDAEPDPKNTLIALARRGKNRAICSDIVPRQGSGARVSPGYSGRIMEFVGGAARPWRPEVAVQRSDSLRRCVEALRNLKRKSQD